MERTVFLHVKHEWAQETSLFPMYVGNLSPDSLENLWPVKRMSHPIGTATPTEC